ncbi:hypothetical protein [Methanolobus sp.]|uniref:hypothetical protein n=1 Tax=Methanolobus sp. TaxID=1874737 RepID=UPI0025D7045B|nr:hypothetical protein [Methanolobus sp.]
MPGEFIGYKDEIKKIEDTIIDFGSEPGASIAIIAGPYTGKSTLMDNLYYKFPLMSTRIKIPAEWDSYEDCEKALNRVQEKIVFIDDCHLLYRRRVGGFQTLRKYLDHIATHPEHLFITSWNIFSWEYLNETLHIEKHFPTQIHLHGLEADEIKSIIMSDYNTGEVIFESGDKNTIERYLIFEKYPLRIKNLERTIDIPVPKLNYSLLNSQLNNFLNRVLKKKSRQNENEKTPEELAFLRIKDISSGNIRLAQIIWQKSLHNSTIKVDEIYLPSFKAKLDYDTTFVGFLILSMGKVSQDSLEDAIGDEIDVVRSLAILRKHELIDIRDRICSVNPEAIQYIESLAKDARMR